MCTHLCKDVRTRVPEGVAPIFGVVAKQLQLAVAFQWPRHIPQRSVHSSDQKASRFSGAGHLTGDVHWRRNPPLALLDLAIITSQCYPGKGERERMHCRQWRIQDDNGGWAQNRY